MRRGCAGARLGVYAQRFRALSISLCSFNRLDCAANAKIIDVLYILASTGGDRALTCSAFAEPGEKAWPQRYVAATRTQKCSAGTETSKSQEI